MEMCNNELTFHQFPRYSNVVLVYLCLFLQQQKALSSNSQNKYFRNDIFWLFNRQKRSESLTFLHIYKSPCARPTTHRLTNSGNNKWKWTA